MQRRFVLLQTGPASDATIGPLGDYPHRFLAGCGLKPEEAAVVRLFENEMPPPSLAVAGVLVTGADAMVTERLPWMVAGGEYLRRCVEESVPVFAVCFGHQLLAQEFGGGVDYMTVGPEYGLQEVRLLHAAKDDPLFSLLPDVFPAQESHHQGVIELPDGAVRLATSSKDANHAFRIGRCAWGVQFHPECSAEAMRSDLCFYADELRADGLDPVALASAVCNTPDATGLLASFVAFAKKCL